MKWWKGANHRWLMGGGLVLAAACGSSEHEGKGGDDAGKAGTGGTATGGSQSGGSTNGGTSNGGTASDGGAAGESTGGAAGTSGGGNGGVGATSTGGVGGMIVAGNGGRADAGMAGNGGAGMAGRAGAGMAGRAGAGMAGNGGAGMSGNGGNGGKSAGGSGGLGSGAAANGSPCNHGGLCETGHCANGVCANAPNWGGALTLSSTPGAPSVAMPSFGEAAVVWKHDSTNRAFARVATAKSFAAETRIDTQSGGMYLSDPKVAFTGGQSYLATWSESFSSPDYRVFARSYSGSWDGSNDIDGATSSMQLPRISTDPRGNGAVVWNGRDDSLVWMRAVNGSSLDAPRDFGVGFDQTVAVSPSGRIAVAWCIGVTGTNDLWVATYQPGSGWANPARAYQGVSGGACYDPVIAISDQGEMAVTWSDGPSVGRPYARFYSPSTGWESTTLVEPGILYGSLSALPVFSESGALLLVWYRVDSAVSDCAVRYRLRLGGVWTDNQTLDECRDGSGFLAAASYDRESFRVIYHHENATVSGRELWDARYVGGQGFRDRRMISPVANTQSALALVLDHSGKGILSWFYRTGTQVSDPSELRAMWLE